MIPARHYLAINNFITFSTRKIGIMMKYERYTRQHITQNDRTSGRYSFHASIKINMHWRLSLRVAARSFD